MTQSQSTVLKIYRSVIEDVITGVRDAFLDEGVDEQVLQELKQIWESKLISSKAVEVNPEPDPQPPQFVSQKDSARNNVSLKTGTQINRGNSYTTYQQQQQHHHQNAVQNVTQQATNQSSHHHPHLAQQSNQSSQGQMAHHPQQSSAPTQAVIVTDPSKQVPIQITLPAQPGGEARVLTIQVPASVLQGNQLQQVLTGPVISATMALPLHLASSLLQQHVNAALQGQVATTLHVPPAMQQQNSASQQMQSQSNSIRQLDGAADTSDEEDEDEDEDDIEDEEENEEKEEDENEEENAEGQEEEPLNSGDDVSDEDPTDLFDTDNVVVCQYDKITRSRNKWKFHLKDGIMNLNGKDYVFQKASGDAEW